jgi:hypothetical protein
MKKITFLFLLISFFGFSNEKKFHEYFQKAKVATFYSSTFLNGYYELDMAFSFVDSARLQLSQIPEENLNKTKFKSQLNALYNELKISESIAVDNLNYIYPHYSLIAGYRQDFNLIDEPEELLIEEVINKHLTQADPFFKGNLIDNSHVVLVNITPFDSTFLQVALDFLGTETSHYAIRPHEIFNLLGDKGYDRYINNSLLKSDFQKILDNYNIDKLYNLSVLDQGSVINNLFYKGCYLNIIDKNQLSPQFLKYFESFKINKSESFNKSIVLLIISFIIFLFLTIVSFEDSFNKIKSRFNIENISADLIIALFVGVSIAISNNLLGLIDPGINAFKGAIESKAWLLVKILAPLSISFVLSFLFTTKFSKVVTTDVRFMRKFIFAALCAPVLSDIFFMSHSKIIFDFNTDFFAIPFLVLIIYPSRVLGLLWHKILNKGEYSRWLILTSILILVNYYLSITYFEQHSENLYIALIAWIPVITLGYFSQTNNSESVIVSEQLNSLTNPYQYIKSGFNISEIENNLEEFINSDFEFVSVLKGKRNVGKTRFIKEFMKKNKSRNEFFFGDFDEFKEGAIQLYEPFHQAFCLHENSNYTFEKGFFSDRSVTFNSLKKVATLASAAAPIDLGEIISIDDNQGLSVNEISGELIEVLMDKLGNETENKKAVLILDDYQWIDSATNELLVNFIDKIKNRKSVTKNIKIVLIVSDLEESLNADNTIFTTSYNDLNEKLKDKIPNFELNCSKPNNFLNSLFDDKGFEYFKSDDSAKNNNTIFSTTLKSHIRDVVSNDLKRLIPGDLFNYFQALKNSELIGIEGNLIRLIKYPDEDFTFEESEQILMKTKFESLNDDNKKIIESAAHTGYKFDASIIAHIWRKDLMDILNVLEDFEKLGLVNDESALDNIYSFSNKNFHKWLRSNHEKENKAEFKQKIIEFQKRIIDSIISKGDSYIQNLDIDILKSVSNRCNLFLKIEEIEIHALKFNIVTAEKLVNLNKLSQSSLYLSKAAYSFRLLNNTQIDSIYKILESFQKVDSNLNKLGIELENKLGQKVSLIDEIFDVLIKKTNKKIRSKSVLIFLLDYYRIKFEYNKIKTKEHLTFLESSLINRINKLKDILNFIEKEDQLRADFYQTIINDNKDSITLSALKKSAIASKEYELAGEISRHLSRNFYSKKTIDLMFENVIDSLHIEGNMIFELENSKYDKIDFEYVHKIVKNLLSNTNISFNKAKSLSYCISRLIELFYLKKEYSSVISLGEMGESLNKRIGDTIGLYIIWAYSGASNLQLNNIDKSIEIYKKHFNLLIKEGSEKKYFIGPLEGILYCCKEKNNYEEFNLLKNEMYEHLLFIDSNMKESDLEMSIINKKAKLEDLIPIQDSVSINNNLSKGSFELSIDIFTILYCISKSDGQVDKSEIHDIKESVNAITFAVGLKVSVNDELINDSKQEIDQLEMKDIEGYFEKKCHVISKNHDKNRLKAIYHFCEDIANADGKIDDNELKLLNIAKSILTN